jgi:hypothetical protein
MMATRTGRTQLTRKKRSPVPAGTDKARAAALARAQCAEIAMLAAAKGWGRKKPE